MSGQLSRDGKHQWTGTEWVPVPPPPRSGLDQAHVAFQVACAVLVGLLLLFGLVALVAS